jgi:hypothetical protein
LGEFLQSEALPMMPKWCPPEMVAFVKHTGENLVIWAEACKAANGKWQMANGNMPDAIQLYAIKGSMYGKVSL